MLGYVTFSKEGPQKVVTESLPRDKKDLERKIAEKFADALSAFHKRTLHFIERNDDPENDPFPDVLARIDGRQIGIELVEVINSKNAAVTSLRRKYLAKIQEGLNQFSQDLYGLEIHINDWDQHPPYPKWHAAKKREEIIQRFISGFESIRKELGDIEPGQLRAYNWGPGPNGAVVRAGVFRRSKKKNQAPHYLTTGSLGENVPDIAHQLARTIKGKCEKYSEHSFKYPLWLLAHETDFYRCENPPSPCVLVASEFLTSKEHPFSEVWYFHPVAGNLHGALECVFQERK